jgi:hypothetical protein
MMRFAMISRHLGQHRNVTEQAAGAVECVAHGLSRQFVPPQQCKLDDQRPGTAAQTRMVSAGAFWPSRGELSRHLKYMARARISEFESSHPSHAVWSPPLDSALSARGKDWQSPRDSVGRKSAPLSELGAVPQTVRLPAVPVGSGRASVNPGRFGWPFARAKKAPRNNELNGFRQRLTLYSYCSLLEWTLTGAPPKRGFSSCGSQPWQFRRNTRGN